MKTLIIEDQRRVGQFREKIQVRQSHTAWLIGDRKEDAALNEMLEKIDRPGRRVLVD